jgi:hypothetical protein
MGLSVRTIEDIGLFGSNSRFTASFIFLRLLGVGYISKTNALRPLLFLLGSLRTVRMHHPKNDRPFFDLTLVITVFLALSVNPRNFKNATTRSRISPSNLSLSGQVIIKSSA